VPCHAMHPACSTARSLTHDVAARAHGLVAAQDVGVLEQRQHARLFL
jgi:hypothetical protein